MWSCSLDPFAIPPAKLKRYQDHREYVPGNEKSQHNRPGILGPLVKHFPKIVFAASGSPGQPASSSHLRGGKNPVHSVIYFLFWFTADSLEREWAATSKNHFAKSNHHSSVSLSPLQNAEALPRIHQQCPLGALLSPSRPFLLSGCSCLLQSH